MNYSHPLMNQNKNNRLFYVEDQPYIDPNFWQNIERVEKFRIDIPPPPPSNVRTNSNVSSNFFNQTLTPLNQIKQFPSLDKNTNSVNNNVISNDIQGSQIPIFGQTQQFNVNNVNEMKNYVKSNNIQDSQIPHFGQTQQSNVNNVNEMKKIQSSNENNSPVNHVYSGSRERNYKKQQQLYKNINILLDEIKKDSEDLKILEPSKFRKFEFKNLEEVTEFADLIKIKIIYIVNIKDKINKSPSIDRLSEMTFSDRVFYINDIFKFLSHIITLIEECYNFLNDFKELKSENYYDFKLNEIDNSLIINFQNIITNNKVDGSNIIKFYHFIDQLPSLLKRDINIYKKEIKDISEKKVSISGFYHPYNSMTQEICKEASFFCGQYDNNEQGLKGVVFQVVLNTLIHMICMFFEKTSKFDYDMDIIKSIEKHSNISFKRRIQETNKLFDFLKNIRKNKAFRKYNECSELLLIVNQIFESLPNEYNKFTLLDVKNKLNNCKFDLIVRPNDCYEFRNNQFTDDESKNCIDVLLHYVCYQNKEEKNNFNEQIILEVKKNINNMQEDDQKILYLYIIFRIIKEALDILENIPRIKNNCLLS
jgi:hypothetical protein